jgi:hypothetical protein
MSSTPSRHARLTSLVGVLLTAAVAACLVAFSLVAQHAALQSPGAPEVRPVPPAAGAGAPIEIPPGFRGEDDEGAPGESSDPSPSAEEELEALIAVADEAPVAAVTREQSPRPGQGFPERGPQRDQPRVAEEGPQDPGRCDRPRCRPDGRPTVARPTPTGEEESCSGKGHEKHADRHVRGRGRGHCEDPETGERPARPPASPAKGRPSSTPPGHPQPSSPPDEGGHSGSPGHSKRSSPPGHSKPSSPPGHSKPSSPPGHSKRSSPSGHSKPSSPPGHSKPSSPPGHSKGSSPPGQAKPSGPPGRSEEAPGRSKSKGQGKDN